MSNTKSTKRALLGSITAMILCLAMLIGTTFAWFTDSASAGVNKVQAGTLKVELQYATAWDSVTGAPTAWANAEGKTLEFRKAAAGAAQAVLWEPGCTYSLPEIRIVNNGNLALKFQIVISGIAGDEVLNKVIIWDYSQYTTANGGYAAAAGGSLSSGDSISGTILGGIGNATDPIVIQGHMDENAGNEYQGKSITGISITVVATQDTVEYDSNNNIYDQNAEYPVIDAAELKTALAAGGVVAIDSEIKVDESKTTVEDRIIIKQPTTLNLDAKLVVPGELEPTANWAALYINADTVLNATEDGGIQCLDKTDGSSGGPYVAHIAGDINVTVNGGTYYGGGTIFNVQSGTLTINGGHFEVTPFGDPYGYNFMINCIDANYQNGTAKIVVKGGTFVNFNPANNAAEGAGTNYVAEGYKVVSETKDNGDIWYTVVPE